MEAPTHQEVLSIISNAVDEFTLDANDYVSEYYRNRFRRKAEVMQWLLQQLESAPSGWYATKEYDQWDKEGLKKTGKTYTSGFLMNNYRLVPTELLQQLEEARKEIIEQLGQLPGDSITNQVKFSRVTSLMWSIAHRKFPELHVVSPGESLSSIAREHYGDAERWMEIFRANNSIANQDLIYPGQVLVLP